MAENTLTAFSNTLVLGNVFFEEDFDTDLTKPFYAFLAFLTAPLIEYIWSCSWRLSWYDSSPGCRGALKLLTADPNAGSALDTKQVAAIIIAVPAPVLELDPLGWSPRGLGPWYLLLGLWRYGQSVPLAQLL